MTVEERRRRRFSEAFRKEQVALIESGKVTIAQVARMYQVKGDNVKRWVEKYGTKELPKQIIVHSSSDYNRLSELEKENKELYGMIGEMQVNIKYLEALITIAKQKLGDDFEKKV